MRIQVKILNSSDFNPCVLFWCRGLAPAERRLMVLTNMVPVHTWVSFTGVHLKHWIIHVSYLVIVCCTLLRLRSLCSVSVFGSRPKLELSVNVKKKGKNRLITLILVVFSWATARSGSLCLTFGEEATAFSVLAHTGVQWFPYFPNQDLQNGHANNQGPPLRKLVYWNRPFYAKEHWSYIVHLLNNSQFQAIFVEELYHYWPSLCHL